MADRRFIPELHGLRGLSALWVMLYHTTPGGLGPFQAPAYGYLGVDVFFLLSGYVIMHTHGAEFIRLDAARIIRFLRLRWWRVYPLYAATVLLSIVVARGRFGAWPSLQAVLESSLLLETWARPGIRVNGPSWSLGVEWIGYFAFPFLACCILRLRLSARLLLVLLPNLVVAAAIARYATDWNPIAAQFSVPRMAAEFGAGCILSTIAQDHPGWQRRYGDAVAAAGLLGLWATLAAGAPHGAVACLGLLMFGVAGSGRWSALALANRPAMFLGRISFALYITHWIILGVIKQMFGQPPDVLERAAVTALFYAIAMPFATLACLAIEEPSRRWSRRRQARSATPPNPAPGPA